jgi:hypothetical protein
MNDPRALLGCLCVWFAAGAALADAPVIRLNESKAGVTIDVTGLPRLPAESAKWGKVLAVYVDRPTKDREGQPAVLGSHQVEKGVLRFVPRFPLVRGVRYRVVLNPAELPGGTGKPVEVVLSLPRPPRKSTTVVTNVYPSADRLPENQLKFYLHFSAPMRQGDSYRHVKLLDARGKPIDLPFLALDQELWDPSGTRFTLFLDPGRIKRGLKPREEVGPVLEEGKRYTLVIERTWKDADGAPLRDNYRKSFSVAAPIDKPIDPKTWKLKLPATGTRAPLRVTFPKSLDQAMLEHLVWVVGADGKRLRGKAEVTQRETVWLFTPSAPWRAGAYNLTADTRLEDLAGNTIGQPFEVDVLRPVQRKVKTETVKVPFAIEK